jgi:hypothetical protein
VADDARRHPSAPRMRCSGCGKVVPNWLERSGRVPGGGTMSLSRLFRRVAGWAGIVWLIALLAFSYNSRRHLPTEHLLLLLYVMGGAWCVLFILGWIFSTFEKKEKE